MTVKLTDFTNELELFLSYDPRVPNPGESAGYQQKGVNIVKVNNEELKRHCAENVLQTTGCPVYVGVHTEQESDSI